jgi:hypothetical protein
MVLDDQFRPNAHSSGERPMSIVKAEQASRYRSIQVLLFVFSLIFFAIISYGYFNLFSRSGYFLAFVGAALMAVFAWYLARVIGTSPGGLRRNWILFVPLVVVSSAGVYNSLMLYLEGNRIISDTIVETQGQFSRLQSTAEHGLAESGATAHVNRVRSLSEALFSEIRNPLNCGQGQEARRLIAELQRELPGFTALSNAGQNCTRNEDVIGDYRTRVDALLARADWNNPVMNNIVSQSNQARQSLEELRSNTGSSFVPTMLQGTLSALETHDSTYRDLRRRLSQIVNVRDLDEGLHISEVQDLGNAFKLPALFIERLDQPATYVYLIVAIGFDLFMVYLFELVSSNRMRRQTPGNSLGRAW